MASAVGPTTTTVSIDGRDRPREIRRLRATLPPPRAGARAAPPVRGVQPHRSRCPWGRRWMTVISSSACSVHANSSAAHPGSESSRAAVSRCILHRTRTTYLSVIITHTLWAAVRRLVASQNGLVTQLVASLRIPLLQEGPSVSYIDTSSSMSSSFDWPSSQWLSSRSFQIVADLECLCHG